MTLLRTQIREALLAKLLKVLPYRVFYSPSYPLALEDLPALTISCEKETRLPDYSTLLGNGQCVHTYELPVVVEGITLGSNDLQRTCEDMALKVMQVTQDDLTLGGLCKTLHWEGIDIVPSNEGEQSIGKVRLTGVALYRCAEHIPEVACD